MNNFRALSESRIFIGSGLLFLLLGLFMPVCEASAAVPDIHSHNPESYSQPGHEEANLSHAGDKAKPCCHDFGASLSLLPSALVLSSSSDDVAEAGAVITDSDSFIFALNHKDQSAYLPDIYFRVSSLPLYLITRRLRV